MDFVRIIKREHVRANDFLAKLAGTSGGALKTRERLAGQFANLLEEHTRKEEAHLYPALRRYGAAKAFLAEARRAHRELNSLAAELARVAQDDDSFLAKVGKIERLARRHMREEERLLSGLRKTRGEAEIRDLDASLSASVTGLAERATETAVAALRHGEEIATESGRHRQRRHRALRAAAESRNETARVAGSDLQRIATGSVVATNGVSELRKAWTGWLGRSVNATARAAQQLLHCTTFAQLVQIQHDLLTESIDNLLEARAQLLRISGGVAEDGRGGAPRRGSGRGTRHET